MALTPDEQTKLDYINDRLAQIEDNKKGAAHVDAFQAAQQPAAPAPATQEDKPTRPFSWTRSILGGIRDAIQNPINALDDLDAWSDSLVGLNHKDNPLRARPTIPQLKGSEEAGGAERLVRGLVSFAIPFTAAMKATSALSAVPLLGRVAAGAEEGATEFTLAGRLIHAATSGAIADFQQEDPVGGNVANMLKDTFGLDNAMIDSLAAEPDDSALVTRLKAAAAGVPVGLAGDAIFEMGAKGLRAYRAWKGTREQNQAIVDNFVKGPVSLEGAHDAADVVGKKRIPTRGIKGTVTVDPSTFTSMDEVLGFLKDKAGAIEMAPEDLERFAKNLIEGEPENALAKLGIDPAKLDFSVYRDPDMLGRLQTGLAHVYEELAQKIGRTGTRVTEQETIRGAEALASTPEVLRDLYGSTRGLAEKLMAGRMIVGAHAHKLLAQANAAIKEIEEGGAGQAWLDFLETFHDHAYLMGTIRGAGSEAARALRSLQTLVKVNPKKAGKILDKAIDEDTAAGAQKAAGMNVADSASEYARLLETNADKIKALKRLVELGGDVAELSRTVREGSNTGLGRISNAVKEMMGSLFSNVTATANTLSSMAYLGLNAAGRYGAAVVRTGLGLVSDAQALQARRARLEAWAITEGIVGGFRPAFQSMLGVIKREILSEASINLDSLGFEKLAKDAELGSARAEKEIGGHYERSDVVGSKAFAMTGSERRRWDAAVDELDGPKFFKAGLKGLVRITGAAINAAGTGYRAGTTLFVNAPDQLMGTIGTRAGAYQSAVRLAAKEAQHLGLEGKEFSSFIKARSQTLFGDGPRGWAEDGEDGGLRHVMARAGTVEAKSILFQDDLEWTLNKKIAALHGATGGFGTLIVPFIKTPLRIIERTVNDFSPLGLATSGRLRKAIIAGGSQRDEALARMSLGMLAMITAYQLADDRTIVGNDGGYLSSARLSRDSYSLKIGDDAYQFSRYDPIGTLLGFGADLREYFQQHGNDPEAQGQATEMFKAMFYGVVANVLSKSWLTSIKNLTDLAGATSSDDADLRWEAFKKSMASRAVPGAGVQKMVEGWGDTHLRQASDFSDGIWQNSMGASHLPVKRDFLGRPIDKSDAERMVGLPGTLMPFEHDDPVGAELERLSFRLPASQRKQMGVKLNATQFSRFLQLRGQEVKDETGLTLADKLKVLVQAPGYQALPTKAAKAAAIHDAVRGYNRLAADALTKEDPSYAQARLKEYVYSQAELQGWSPQDRDTRLTQQSQALAAWLQHQQK